MISPSPEACIDIGANVTSERFTADIDIVLERARTANITHIVVTGTSLSESEQAILLAKKYSGQLYCTAGVHPHDAKNFTKQSYQQLKSFCQEPCVRAVGEIGLDFNRNFSSPEQQVLAFEKQIELACETGLPLFLHERDAHDKQWQILQHYRDDFSAAVIHCFTGSKAQAFRYLDLDLSIGITGWICDERRGLNLQQIVKDIPLDRLMLETDAPYLMPRVKPRPALMSKSRNEPCTLPYILKEIANNRSESEQEIAIQTTINAKHFFNIKDSI